MKTVVSIALAATFLCSTLIFADPVSLTNSEMDQITAGFGANDPDTEGSKFAIHHLAAADGGIGNSPNVGGVGVPSAVPTTISCGDPFLCAPAP